jgi:hypothetical protein
LQNYTPGNPASVLYIKNLSKDVIHDDFYYVFGEAVTDCFFVRGLASLLIRGGNILQILKLVLKVKFLPAVILLIDNYSVLITSITKPFSPKQVGVG